MTSNNNIMEHKNKVEAVREFTRLMYQKGYRGRFFLDLSRQRGICMKDELIACLEEIIKTTEGGPQGEDHYELDTLTKDNIQCSFRVTFDEKEGFRVREMTVKNKHNQDKRYFHIVNNQLIMGSQGYPPYFLSLNPGSVSEKGNSDRNMKRINIKTTGLAILLLICTINVPAQGLGEWFNQKKTQTKYLVQQIVALQVYLGYLKKGYDITKNGLNLIGDIKNGEFYLHKDYFNRLKTVNPKIMKYPKIAGILSMQVGILNQRQATIKLSKESKQFSDEERNYIKQVFDNLEGKAEKDLDELQLVITNGQMQMTDDERIKHIDKIYNQVQDKYSFSKTFSEQINRILEQKKLGTREAQEMQSLYSIPPNKTK